jgi:hypothetical protein
VRAVACRGRSSSQVRRGREIKEEGENILEGVRKDEGM